MRGSATAHGLLPAGRRRPHRASHVLVAEIDAASIEIIGGYFNDHPVADAGANPKFAHLAGHIGEQLVVVVEPHAIVSVREYLGHGAVEFQKIFLAHPSSVPAACLLVLPVTMWSVGRVRATFAIDLLSNITKERHRSI